MTKLVAYSCMNHIQRWVCDMRRDYTNNYLTIDKYAEHSGISKEFAEAVIAEGNRVEELYELYTRE